jgi:hypothetical protein
MSVLQPRVPGFMSQSEGYSGNLALTAYYEVRRDDPRYTPNGGCATLALGASWPRERAMGPL